MVAVACGKTRFQESKESRVGTKRIKIQTEVVIAAVVRKREEKVRIFNS